LQLRLKAFTENRILYLAALVSMFVIVTGSYRLTAKYIIPVYKGEITFIHDFSFYQTAAQNFLNNPESMYPENISQKEIGFLYPPPSIIIFLPFAGLTLPLAYSIFLFISLIFLFAAVFISLKTAEVLIKKSLNNRTKLLIYIISIGNAPVYMNFQSSQVGTIIIFLIALFIYFLVKKKYLQAALALSSGILLKIYPLFLIPGALFKTSRKKFITGLISSILLIILISLFFIPVDLYSKYFFEIIPAISNFVEMNTYNQSLTAVIIRFTDLYQGGWGMTEVPIFIKAVNNILFLILLAYAAYKTIKAEDMQKRVVFILIIMSAIPVFSNFGWGHLYILAIPLLVHYLFHYPVSGLIIFLLFAIDIPDSIFHKLDSFLLSNLFHARFLIGVLTITLFYFFHSASPVLKSSLSSSRTV
jgi:alpha-1,2-mannosyltransferase